MAIPGGLPHHNTLQHTAPHCTTLHHTATHCNTLQHSATHGSTLQHVIHKNFNVQQHTRQKMKKSASREATYSAIYFIIARYPIRGCGLIKKRGHVCDMVDTYSATYFHTQRTVHHSATQCIAVHHSASQCNILQHTTYSATYSNTLQHTSSHCSTLQHTVSLLLQNSCTTL